MQICKYKRIHFSSCPIHYSGASAADTSSGAGAANLRFTQTSRKHELSFETFNKLILNFQNPYCLFPESVISPTPVILCSCIIRIFPFLYLSVCLSDNCKDLSVCLSVRQTVVRVCLFACLSDNCKDICQLFSFF